MRKSDSGPGRGFGPGGMRVRWIDEEVPDYGPVADQFTPAEYDSFVLVDLTDPQERQRLRSSYPTSVDGRTFSPPFAAMMRNAAAGRKTFDNGDGTFSWSGLGIDPATAPRVGSLPAAAASPPMPPLPEAAPAGSPFRPFARRREARLRGEAPVPATADELRAAIAAVEALEREYGQPVSTLRPSVSDIVEWGWDHALDSGWAALLMGIDEFNDMNDDLGPEPSEPDLHAAREYVDALGGTGRLLGLDYAADQVRSFRHGDKLANLEDLGQSRIFSGREIGEQNWADHASARNEERSAWQVLKGPEQQAQIMGLKAGESLTVPGIRFQTAAPNPDVWAAVNRVTDSERRQEWMPHSEDFGMLDAAADYLGQFIDTPSSSLPEWMDDVHDALDAQGAFGNAAIESVADVTVRRTEEGFTVEVDAGHFLLDRYDFDWGDSGARLFRPLQESGGGKPFHALASWRRKASYVYDPDGWPWKLRRAD